MAALCHFYGWTPRTVWDLTVDEVAAFMEFRTKWYEAQSGGD